LERLEGIKIDDQAALEAAAVDRRLLAEHATRMILTMVFRDGFFHADPHPGNFFVEPDGRIGLMDFGMVGALDEPLREALLSGLLAITRRDADALADALLECGVGQGPVDHEQFRRDLDRLLARYYDHPLQDLAIGPLIADAQALVRQHGLRLPVGLALLLKTIVMYEGLGQRLDPGFNMATVLGPFAKQAVLSMYGPRRTARRLAAAGMDATRLALDLPRLLRRLLGELERGQLAVGVRPEHIEPALDRLERLTNRVVVGIIAAALINGLAVLMSVYHPFGDDRWLGLFFAVGFFSAAALGLYLAWSIVRSK
jgi:ubiquinone biosynthesis protein